MKFHEVLEVLRPYLGTDSDKRGSYVVDLVNTLLREPMDDKEIELQKKDEYNPLAKLNLNTLDKIYNGSRKISKKNARIICSRFDGSEFVNKIDDLYDADKEVLVNFLEKNDIEVSIENLGQVFKNVILEILTDIYIKRDKKEVIEEKIIDFYKYEFFNESKFTSLGASVVIARWKENNNSDIELFELLTGKKYVDICEDIRIQGFNIFKDGYCEIPNRVEFQEVIIEALDKEHLVLIMSSLKDIILKNYNQLSIEAFNGIMEFISTFSAVIYKCKRINGHEFYGIIYNFEESVLEKANYNQMVYFGSYIDRLVEIDEGSFLSVINKHIKDDKSVLIKELNGEKSVNISYHLAYVLSKVACNKDLFLDALEIMFTLVKYNNVFAREISNVLNLTIKYTDVSLSVKKGVLTRFLKCDKDVTWNIMYSVVNNEIEKNGYEINFYYANQVFPFFSYDEKINERIEYIELLCENVGDSVEKYVKLLDIIPFVSDDEVEIISNLNIDMDIDDQQGVKIYEKIVKLNRHKKSKSYERSIKKIGARFNDYKKYFERITLFSGFNTIGNNPEIDEKSKQVILEVFEEKGVKGLVEFGGKIGDILYYIKMLLVILLNKDYFELLDYCIDYNCNELLTYCLSETKEEVILDYVGKVDNIKRLKVLYTYKVSENIYRYIQKKSEKIRKIYWENVTSVGASDLDDVYLTKYIEKLIKYKNYRMAIIYLYISVGGDRGEKYRNIMYKILELYDIPDDNVRYKYNDLVYPAIQRIIGFLQKNVGEDIEKICNIEEKYIEILKIYETIKAKSIYHKMANNPEYVKNLCLKSIEYRDEGIYNSKFDILLYNFGEIPGMNKEGIIDEGILMDWKNCIEDISDSRVEDLMKKTFAKGLKTAFLNEDGFCVNDSIFEFIETNNDISLYIEVELLNLGNIKNRDIMIKECDDFVKKCEEQSYLKAAKIIRNIKNCYIAMKEE